MKENDTRRYETIDVFRGFGILLMVMGHIGFGTIFNHYIHAFHMPLFFFISGFLHKSHNQIKLGKFIKGKLKRFIIPYIIFGLVNYFAWIVLFKTLTHSDINILEPLSHLLFINTNGMMIAGALWFLTCIFFVEILFEILSRIIKNEKFFFIVIVLIFLFGNISYKTCDSRLPFALDISFIALFIYYIGFLFRKHSLNDKKVNYCLIILVFILNALLIINTQDVNMRMGQYPSAFLFIINCILAVILYYYIFNQICLSQNKIIVYIKKKIEYVGKNSILYLCINELAIVVFGKIFSYIPGVNSYANIFILIATMLSIKIANELIKRTKIKSIIQK